MGIDSLPDDVMRLLFGSLNHVARRVAARVCRRWRALIDVGAARRRQDDAVRDVLADARGVVGPACWRRDASIQLHRCALVHILPAPRSGIVTLILTVWGAKSDARAIAASVVAHLEQAAAFWTVDGARTPPSGCISDDRQLGACPKPDAPSRRCASVTILPTGWCRISDDRTHVLCDVATMLSALVDATIWRAVPPSVRLASARSLAKQLRRICASPAPPPPGMSVAHPRQTPPPLPTWGPSAAHTRQT